MNLPRSIRYPLLLLILLGRPRFAGAQFLIQPADSLLTETPLRRVTTALDDSLRRLQQLQQRADWPRVLQLSNYLLTRYPGRVGPRPVPATDRVVRFYHEGRYPYEAYDYRLQAHRALGDYRGQEADLTGLIRYDPVAHAYPALRTRHYAERAVLRLQQLRDPAGGCADLQEAYLRDTTHAAALRRWDCGVPARRYMSAPADRQLAEAALRDSVNLIKRLLARRQFGAALRTANTVRAGRIGPFMGIRPHELPQANTELWALRARARQGLGDYRGALADYDTALTRVEYTTPASRAANFYQRGIFKLDVLQDREGGCADLAQSYEVEPLSTGPHDPRWRGCGTGYKMAISPAQKAEAGQLYRDSLAAAQAAVRAGRYAQARRSCDLLLDGYVGPYYARDISNLYDYTTSSLVRQQTARTRETRALALQGLGEYALALADLDQAVGDYPQAYCTRGTLKIDYLHNPAAGCADLQNCYRYGQQPVRSALGLPRWRGCYVPARRPDRLVSRYVAYPIQKLLEPAERTTGRVGLFYQGTLGVEAGALFSPGEWLATYGPSVGADLVFQPLLLAPKLSYEGELAIVGGRLDVAYYLGYYKGAPRGDLRLTPQIGLSAGALLNLFYGYSVPVAGQEIGALGRHRISLYLNFLKISKLGG